MPGIDLGAGKVSILAAGVDATGFRNGGIWRFGMNGREGGNPRGGYWAYLKKMGMRCGA